MPSGIFARFDMQAFVRLLLCAVLTAPLSATEVAPEGSVRTGAHYRVVCHFENDAVASTALETAEAAWVIAAEIAGERAPAPEEPLAIHLYRTSGEYEAVEKRLSAGLFKENLSFSDHRSKSAHVAIQPEYDDARFKAIGLPALTRHLVAHEAAHLASYSMWRNHSSHPAWLAEGFATWVGVQALVRRGSSRGFDEDPYLARNVVLARDLAARGALPGFERILRDELDGLGRYERYAVWQTLFQFLRSDGQLGRMAKLLAVTRELDGGPDYREEVARSAVRIFGDESGFAGIDRDFAAFLAARRPRWDETRRALDTAGDRWVQQAFPAASAIAWRTEPVGAASYVVGGEIEILPGGEGELRVLLGRRPRGFVGVGFRAGYGVVVSAYEEGAGSALAVGEKLARARVESLTTGRRIAFRIEVEPGRVRVAIDKQTVLEADVRDRPLGGPWGLAAEAGTLGIWRRVDVVRR